MLQQSPLLLGTALRGKTFLLSARKGFGGWASGGLGFSRDWRGEGKPGVGFRYTRAKEKRNEVRANEGREIREGEGDEWRERGEERRDT